MTLRANRIGVHFEGVKALDGLDLELNPAEILGLIGPNGAGKTTLVNVLTGYQQPTDGTVELDGQEITSWTPDRRARNGLIRTFQRARTFPELTVTENVQLGVLAVGGSRRRAESDTDALLHRFDLTPVSSEKAGTLPGGAERILGIARALAASPRFLLLDEPAAGLNENEVDELLSVLQRVQAEQELGLLIIEHDMRFVMRLCDRICVLDFGRLIASGDPATVRADPAVLAAYLGSTAKGAPDARS